MFLYFIKNLGSLVCREPGSSFIDVRDCLKVWMNLSAKPLVAGWYGADVVRLTPFFFRNSWNSSEVNCDPLSLTNCSSSPFRANTVRRASTVLEVVALECMIITSGHFEVASTTTKNVIPRNGPAKPMWIRCQEVDGHYHGCKGEHLGAC